MALVLDLLSALLLTAGVAFCVIGAVGMLRMPDFYSRTHAASLADTLGAPLILIGLALQSMPALDMVTAKLFIVMLFLLMTSPVAAHALGKAAWRRGLKPWTTPKAMAEEAEE